MSSRKSLIPLKQASGTKMKFLHGIQTILSKESFLEKGPIEDAIKKGEEMLAALNA